jgi:cardiolipin synthase C
VRRALAGELTYEWVPVRMVSDDPAKGLGRAAPEAMIWQRLKNAIGEPAREVQLVSPYFVPTAAGVEALTALARQGVKLTVLTNSLAATDVAAVHAGYAKQRKALLEAGIALYEMKPTAAAPGAVEEHTRSGSSASSLHAKTFAVDRARIFIGSFNFDPRSAQLNTEMGFVIESQALAQRLADLFAGGVPQRAYAVRVSADGALEWIERESDGVIVHDTEPHSSFGRRLAIRLLSLLPIEWML